MDHAVHNKLVSFIWSIADDCLRDVYVRGKYRDGILPMVVLRRLDTLLEPTKDAVLEEVEYQKPEMGSTEVDPQNPNPRGYRDGEVEADPLDEIIRTFNERWFQGWSATPEEQRVKFINIAESVRAHPDFESKYENNPGPQNRGLAFEKMLRDVMLKRRKDELELYKLFANDPAFKAARLQSLERVVNQDSSSQNLWARGGVNVYSKI